jgi:hypothetical protein
MNRVTTATSLIFEALRLCRRSGSSSGKFQNLAKPAPENMKMQFYKLSFFVLQLLQTNKIPTQIQAGKGFPFVTRPSKLPEAVTFCYKAVTSCNTIVLQSCNKAGSGFEAICNNCNVFLEN